MLRFRQFQLSTGLQDGLIMTGSTFLAGLLDYGTNVLAGQRLPPTQYSLFIAVMALLQLALHVTNVGRNLVAYHSADIAARSGNFHAAGRFLRIQFRRAVRLGLAAAAVMAITSPLTARCLSFPSPWPVAAGALALLILFIRPVTDGTLQGIQQFLGLGAVNVLQAALRILFTLAFIAFGWQAAGAILGLPVAMSLALLLALWLLRPVWGAADPAQPLPTLRSRYSLATLFGLLAFALMVNLDAILVQPRFPGATAGNYGPLVTLGKINLFLPLALGMVIFPKAIERRRQGRSGQLLILAAQLAALTPGVVVTAAYFLFPETILGLLFGSAYGSLGKVMGLVGVATTLFALAYLWLQYALSLEQTWYPALLSLVVLLQAAGMLWFSPSLVPFVWIMIGAGAAANLGGLLLLRR